MVRRLKERTIKTDTDDLASYIRDTLSFDVDEDVSDFDFIKSELDETLGSLRTNLISHKIKDIQSICDGGNVEKIQGLYDRIADIQRAIGDACVYIANNK